MRQACAVDARVALLEVMYVFITVHVGRQLAVPGVTSVTVPMPSPPVRSVEITGATWEFLDQVDLGDVCLQRIPVLKQCPRRDPVAESRAWKLFGLAPIMLLHRPRHTGSVGRDELCHRADEFVRGRWADLLNDAQDHAVRQPRKSQQGHDDKARRGAAAQSRVQRGQVSRGRHELTGAPLAPRNNVTLEELRRQRPQEQQSAIPQEVLEFSPGNPLQFQRHVFVDCLKSAPSGSAPGPGGCTYELLRVCLDDHEILDLLCSAAEDFARAQPPHDVMRTFMLANMTALQKKDGGVRGIATGTSFRRLVSKTLARQFMTAVEETCDPFQFALSTRAGTDCVGHAIRAATDADHEATVLSIDGVGAYDHVNRSVMLSKLLEIPSLQPLLPFVRAANSEPTRYKWQDDEGHRHDIEQHEGGEQGDPLMPLLFSLAIHNALEAVKEELEAGEMLFAFLDDMYVLSRSDRAPHLQPLGREAPLSGRHPAPCRHVEQERDAATRYRRSGTKRVAWSGHQSVGHASWFRRLRAIPHQCAIGRGEQVVGGDRVGPRRPMRVADPRAVCRATVSPPYQDHASQPISTVFCRSRRWNAEGNENHLGKTSRGCFTAKRGSAHCYPSHAYGWIGTPFRGQDGSRSVLGSWADAMPMLSRRLPELTTHIIDEMARGSQGCLAELSTACARLDRSGFISRPGWPELRAGERPPPPRSTELGEWQHGWQCHASSSLEYQFRETVVLAQSCSADQAHLRSHSGPGTGEVLLGAPTGPEFRVEPQLFRILVLERLRVPLDVTESKCECGCFLDTTGRHRAACPRSGRLRTRAVGPERTLARVCREAGATVRINTKLRDMNVAISFFFTLEMKESAVSQSVNHARYPAWRSSLSTSCTEGLGPSAPVQPCPEETRRTSELRCTRASRTNVEPARRGPCPSRWKARL